MKPLPAASQSAFIRGIYRKYLFASLMGCVLSGLGGIFTSAMLGNLLNAGALSVTSICSPLSFAFSAAGALIVMGGLTLCARYTGQGQQRKADECFTATMLLTVLAGVAISLVLFLLREPMVALLCPLVELRADVRAYYTVLVAGGTFHAVGQVAACNFLRQDGKPNAMIAVTLGNLLFNVGLSYVLVRAGLGVCAAAVGSVVGSAFMAAALFGVIGLRGSTVHFVKMRLRQVFAYLPEMAALGTTSFLENSCFTLRSVCLNAILAANFGALSLAAFSLVGTMINIHNMMLYGIVGAAMPFIGVLTAERDSVGVRRVLRQEVSASVWLAVPATLLCMVFSPQIVHFFGLTEPAEAAAAVPAVRWYSLSFLPGILNHALISLHMNNKRTRLANLLTVGRLFAYGLLAALALMGVLGVNAVWHSFWLGELLTMATALLLQSKIAAKTPGLARLTLLDEGAERRGSSVSIPVHNTQQGIADACEATRRFAATQDLDAHRSMYLSLAVEEILLALRTHALDGNEKADIDVYILHDGSDLLLRFRTGGKMFDPVTYAKAHKPAAAAESADDFSAIMAQAALEACEVVQYTATFGVNNLTVVQHARA